MDPARPSDRRSNGATGRHQSNWQHPADPTSKHPQQQQQQQQQPTTLVPNGGPAAPPPALRSRALPQIRRPSATTATRRDHPTGAATASVPPDDGGLRRLPRQSPLAELLTRQIPSPNWHSQSGLRRTVSMGTHHHHQQQQLRTTRSTVAAAAAAEASTEIPESEDTNQHPAPLPPVSARVRSPSQRLTEMARMFSSGVVYSAHRSGSAGSASFDASSLAATSAKKRL
ncbi:hypothetical protein BOX15_Mlig013279g2 [Macrostomum lignano]|uniref:Uncharacterized protein n=1 Tax=Macrostomum lignano TaxID=282301 RepID=A0A267H6V8_9PLAT|nr:hypothetical protein BOX15_Mlig013279g2 [Macrostomum lignano]